MRQRRQMLEKAMSIGQKELQLLIKGDVFEAEKLAESRGQIVDEAVKGLSRDNLNDLADTLRALKSLHEEITGEAKRLHKSLRQDLTSMKKQNRRIAGYSVGSGNIPKLATERFVSKKG
ncbi:MULTISPECIES: hypothetical protein [unclassified Pseudodesulfovibrio]|uniref:hypothetical protein n=1 Tax=unclassified Pseudodesulfovibrio TaxID=2661612 RepID=UPI000FEB602D|nr:MULTISPECIES: hypothetical protein [unclassified Pseudodesulfovibrio]MCJ2164170.1 hypothetical protein [Pseudodesulfovibrio sp. S3-i]RWU05203.1 hypothetical protein DWB63_05985 [Pseudodesulfovibrio sp. S3]